MQLQKQNVNINFAQGLDTKTDPKQVQPGKMLVLENTIFDKGGLLQKRNGFQGLPFLPDSTSKSLSTFNNNLLAIGTSIRAFSENSNQWVDSGSFQPVDLTVLPLVRSATSQTTADVAIGSNGLACATWLDSDGNSYYQVIDPSTGQIVLPSVQLPATATMPRVFALGFYFIVTFLVLVSGAPRLRRIAVSVNNLTMPSTATDITSQVSSLAAAYDGAVSQDNLYLAWDGSDPGGAVRTRYLTSTLQLSTTRVISGKRATRLSVNISDPHPGITVWLSFWDSTTNNGWAAAYDQVESVVLAATQIITGEVLSQITSVAIDDTLTVLYSIDNTYTYSSTQSDYVKKTTITEAAVVTAPTPLVRSVSLAGKAFTLASTGQIYALVAYGGAFQPSYFLIDSEGKVISKLAYSNGAGYPIDQIMPSVTVSGSTVQMGYLLKSQITPVNKNQGVASAAGIYAQNGINLATFTISNSVSVTSEIGNNLNLCGGFLWAYDGLKPVEQNFHVWPEDLLATPSGAGGSMSAQQYFYSVTYEWTDAQGNIHRSAPSVPLSALTASATSKVTLDIPTLRLTEKVTPQGVRIVIYRWSTAQQIYYQVTSITSPLMSDPSVDSVQYVDTQADADILGNLILYTTGGVVENIGPPPCSTSTLFKSRLFLVDAEDRSLLWYSKQVLEKTPVEMSDLFTIFIAPTISAQGNTGPITALSAMDDKLIIFKRDAIYYVTGNGPDITGANNDFGEPVFITATVGCNNQQSIVFCPQGLLFESDKGRWLLGRDLSTSYLGAPVEIYNSAATASSINVPGTNQVRMTLDNDVTLMYDYYFNQWGTFTHIPAVSSTIYQGLHTYLNSLGQVFQENPGSYLDGSSPVLMKFTTAWMALAGLQGFQRAYFFYLLGQYASPHKLNVQVGYDFDPAYVQTSLVSPTNFSAPFGGDPLYGSGTPFGGPSAVEQWRVFLARQKCQSFQITVSEIYDASLGVTAGAGLTLSGIDLVFGSKKGYPRLPSVQSVG